MGHAVARLPPSSGGSGCCAPAGGCVLVEGNWSTGAGLAAEETIALVEATGRTPTLRRMPEPVFWGREITDDRYLVVESLLICDHMVT